MNTPDSLSPTLNRAVRRARLSTRKERVSIAWLALALRTVGVLEVALNRWNDREDRLLRLRFGTAPEEKAEAA